MPLEEPVPLGVAVALGVRLGVAAPLAETLLETEGEAPKVKVGVGDAD